MSVFVVPAETSIVYSMPSASAVSASRSKSFGLIVEPREIAGPLPRPMLALHLRVAARHVGRVRDVHRDRDRRLERERRDARAAEVADLLLHRRDRRDLAGCAAGLGDEPRRLERDERAEPVVERARGDAAVRQLDRLARDHDDVARPHELSRLVAVLRADVDVQVVEHRSAAGSSPLRTFCFAALDHTRKLSVLRQHEHALRAAAPRRSNRRRAGRRRSRGRRCA